MKEKVQDFNSVIHTMISTTVKTEADIHQMEFVDKGYRITICINKEEEEYE